MILAIFDLNHPDASYQVLSQLTHECRSRFLKQIVDAERRRMHKGH